MGSHVSDLGIQFQEIKEIKIIKIQLVSSGRPILFNPGILKYLQKSFTCVERNPNGVSYMIVNYKGIEIKDADNGGNTDQNNPSDSPDEKI